MRFGIVVLCVFAAIWGAAGVLVGNRPEAWIALPIVVSAVVLTYAWGRPEAKVEKGPHVGRLVGIWSGVEGAAMFVAANVLINTHHRDALMPAFAIIVGLHFLPLARGIPVRSYYLTGAALVAVGAIALLAPLNGPLFVGVAAAVILWASAIALARGAA
jgi:hypothetical protein